MRIGFLFNHDQIHQVAHSLPVAIALAKAGTGAEVIVATTNERLAAEVARLLGPNRPEGLSTVELSLKSGAARGFNTLFAWLAPTAKVLIYKDNLDFFRSLDALVVTERTSLILKTKFRLSKPIMILTDHGAGDRAIGFGESTALFDHILAAGPKIRDRLVKEAGVDPTRLTITGYPKFDIQPGATLPEKFRNSDKPVVLYNPHVSPHLSSWYKQGREVLDYFLASDRYNLIFAPHIMMFERRLAFTVDKWRVALPGRMHPKYAAAPNIHVDLGSLASTDMTYTNLADVYVGDVSSQVYEFLRHPRPCVFINSHRVAYQADPNFAHWQAGPVIEDVHHLDRALTEATQRHKSAFEEVQQKLFDYTFDLGGEPSSDRAAGKIAGLLGLTSEKLSV